MAQKKRGEAPAVVQKLYDVILWTFPLVAKFPKDKRHTLGSRMESLLMETLELLLEAAYGRDKLHLLKKANINLEKFRFLARLAKDLCFIDMRRFGYLAGEVNEVGSMLGGWIKQQTRT